MTSHPVRSYCYRAAALLLCGVTFGGCEGLLGIEPVTLDAKLVVCRDYCDEVLSGNCNVYEDQNTCMSVCSLLEQGDDEDPTGNTIACRQAEAVTANATGEDSRERCAHAGPAGGGDCGTPCESYCLLHEQVCPDLFATAFRDSATCQTECEVFHAEANAFDVGLHDTGDSLQCRIVKLSAIAAGSDSESDCLFTIANGTGSPCVDPPESAPDCERLCRASMVACPIDGEREVYESIEQCLAVCGALDPGESNDTVQNTAFCRIYHGYSALSDPAFHCSHAGPGGDGHCGGPTSNCASYCHLLEVGCEAEFTTHGSPEACSSACNAAFPDQETGGSADSKYSVAKGEDGGPTLHCRLLQVARTLALPESDRAESCSSAVGIGECN